MNDLAIQYARLLDASEVATAIGLEKARPRNKWACPACSSSDALNVYPGPGRGSTCFSCRKSMDALGLVMVTLSMGFMDALKWLGAQFGFSDVIKNSGGGSRSRVRDFKSEIDSRRIDREKIKAQRLDVARGVWNEVWEILDLTEKGAKYMEFRGIPRNVSQHIGLRSVDTMSQWRAICDLFTPEHIEDAGLVGENASGTYTHPWFAPFIIMPYWLEAGGIDVLRFRNISKKGPKCVDAIGHSPTTAYMNHTGSAMSDDYSTLYVCEGEINAMSVLYAGFPAISSHGASSWSSDWSQCFRWWKRVIVLADNDEAGVGFYNLVKTKTAHAIGQKAADRKLSELYFPKGHDANDALMAGKLLELLS